MEHLDPITRQYLGVINSYKDRSGMSTTELARRLGLSDSNVGKKLRGEVPCRPPSWCRSPGCSRSSSPSTSSWALAIYRNPRDLKGKRNADDWDKLSQSI